MDRAKSAGFQRGNGSTDDVKDNASLRRSNSLHHAYSSARTLFAWQSYSRRGSAASATSPRVGDASTDTEGTRESREGGREGKVGLSARSGSIGSGFGGRRGSLKNGSQVAEENGGRSEGLPTARRLSLKPVKESNEPSGNSSSAGEIDAASVEDASSKLILNEEQKPSENIPSIVLYPIEHLPSIAPNADADKTAKPVSEEAGDPDQQQRQIDELTTLVAFGVIIPSLTQEGGAGLPLSATSAYQHRFSVPSSCPPAQPPKPTAPPSEPSEPAPRRKRAGSFGGRMQRDYMPPPTANRSLDDSVLDMGSQGVSQAVQFRTVPRRPSLPSTSTTGIFKPSESGATIQSSTPSVRRLSNPHVPTAPTNVPTPPSTQLPPPPLPISLSLPPKPPKPSSTPPPPVEALHIAGVGREFPAFEQKLRSLMTSMVFLKDELIFKKNDVGREMYFLVKGKVEVLNGDLTVCYNVIEKGSFFGELGILYDIPRTASVRAAQNCYCMILSRADLMAVMKDFPLIATRFRKVVQARMRDVQAKRHKKSRLDFVPVIGMVEEEEDCDGTKESAVF
ncbi:Kinesin-like protein kif27 [Rhizophlyctis rosea]|uniref:Kinesin-like protein kif27 n=1 Tax=Rhizophlyctis rosea TaxID=64517 RepID=A0AAD5X7H5_9FUNG|nr:Kinesin-like protein kif27 [Rhizophlyctis rosea]